MFKLLKNIFNKTEEVNNDQFFNKVEKEIKKVEPKKEDISPPVQNILRILKEEKYSDLFLTSTNDPDIWIGLIYLDTQKKLKISRLYSRTPFCKTEGIYPEYQFIPTNTELSILHQEFKSAWEKFEHKKNSEGREGIDNILTKYIKD